MDNFQAQVLLKASTSGDLQSMQWFAENGEGAVAAWAQENLAKNAAQGFEYRHSAPKLKGPSPS